MGILPLTEQLLHEGFIFQASCSRVAALSALCLQWDPSPSSLWCCRWPVWCGGYEVQKLLRSAGNISRTSLLSRFVIDAH